ncbi:hypothetical protein [Pseudomonas silensiensis]|uniref:hypothetical protein n=1 Tax=Pseudomonas silensiensis TaxID=2991049 RepID=UPI003D22346C
MGKPIILANENLVLDGEFEKGFSHWKKGPVNQDWLGTSSETYEGILISFLKAGNKSSVSQSLTIPKDPGAQARYVLSFLCEMRHTEAGRLVVSIDGQQETLEILLLPGKPRDLEEDQARLKSGQPLVFKPIEYEVDLDLPFLGQDTITVSVFSPPNELGDYTSQVCITRIKLLLHLEPAQMQRLILDDEPVLPSGTLHLCLGAAASFTHQLKFDLAPDNTWLGTKAALTSNDNPQEAIVTTPGWGVDHPIEDQWRLDCPWIGDEEPYLFSINLLNQYTAEPYPITVSLGHHRLVFRDVQEAAYYPIPGQSVCLGVRVASYYTGQFLSGRTVNWTVTATGVKSAAVTNTDGWAYFPFEPTDAGEYDIQASVDSPYYATGVVTQMLTVRVLATDPWKEVLAVVEEQGTPWEERIGYPNRGSTYQVHVKLPAVLSGTDVCLHWSGDSVEQLGVTVNPALETPVPVEGSDVLWTLTSEDRLDGRFELSLVCSKLLLPSPKKRMSLARNLVKIGDVREANKFPVVDEQERVLLRVQVLHVVASGDGGPVINALVDWETPEATVSTVTGRGGWASLLYTPKRAEPHDITAKVRAHTEAVPIEQPFNVKPLATSPWKSEVKILLDNVEVDRVALGVLCRRGQTHTLKVEPVSGSSWVGKNISLHWRGAAPDIGLVPGDLGTPKPLLASGVEWTLVSEANTSLSSLFELELRLDGVSTVRELSGRLVSVDLTEEVSLVLDQVPATLDGQTLYPCLGALHRLNVQPNALSPLVGLMSSLTWSGTPAEQLGATVKPALNLPQPISDAGALWTLDFTASEKPGQFALALALPQLDFVATAKPMALAHNKVRIETFRESPVDPVVGQDPAWQWVRVFSHFTGNAVDQVPVTWTTSESSSEAKTDDDGWSGFAYAPAAGNLEHRVEALVVSPYDGYQEQRAMTVTALASDPWEGLRVSFDKQPFQPWGEKTWFPRRKGEHSVDLEAASNSPLFGHPLTLGMTGTGPAELGIRFLSEGLGVPRPFYDAGLQYLFNVGDLKDGSFALRLSSERLASLSPANAMSLGEGSQVVKIAERQRVNQTLLWGAEVSEQITVVSRITGKPMSGLTVTWRSPDLGVTTSITNFYGVAKIRFMPATPGAFELTASVGDALNSDSVSLPFYLSEPRQIKELVSDDPPGYPGQERTARVLVISANTDEPLVNVEVMWEYDNTSLAPTLTDADGKATVRFTPGVSGEAVLWASVKGGQAGWDTKSLVLTVLEASHAAVESVVASVNPVPVNTFVTMTAQIVDKETRQPMSGRGILVSNNGAPFTDATTDHNGKYLSYWRPMDTSDVVSLAVKVENSDGSSDIGAVDVTVVD